MIDVKSISKLARLQLTKEEEESFKLELESIFKYFEQIKNIDTEGVEPLVTPAEIENYYREDKVSSQWGAEEAMSNAPEKSGHLFKVPPVV